jgi:hypothetical protein
MRKKEEGEEEEEEEKEGEAQCTETTEFMLEFVT